MGKKLSAATLKIILNFIRSIDQVSSLQLHKIEKILIDEDPPPLLLKQKELAREANVCRQTVKSWLDKGLITAITLPDGQLRFKLSDIIKEQK